MGDGAHSPLWSQQESVERFVPGLSIILQGPNQFGRLDVFWVFFEVTIGLYMALILRQKLHSTCRPAPRYCCLYSLSPYQLHLIVWYLIDGLNPWTQPNDFKASHNKLRFDHHSSVRKRHLHRRSKSMPDSYIGDEGIHFWRSSRWSKWETTEYSTSLSTFSS